jgi:hypothetical protein
MFQKRFKLRICLVVLTIGGLLLVTAEASKANPDYPNAIGCKNGTYYGSRASIETSDPQIRDLLWSIVRTFSQNQNAEHNWYAEMGWYKGIDTAWSPKVTAIASGSSGNLKRYYNILSIGSTHDCYVKHNGSNVWGFFFDGTQKVTMNLGFSSTTRVCSGGEASTSANAIGISGCLNNKRRSSSGTWSNYGSHYKQVTSGYWVTDIDVNNWQVGGNN